MEDLDIIVETSHTNRPRAAAATLGDSPNEPIIVVVSSKGSTTSGVVHQRGYIDQLVAFPRREIRMRHRRNTYHAGERWRLRR